LCGLSESDTTAGNIAIVTVKNIFRAKLRYPHLGEEFSTDPSRQNMTPRRMKETAFVLRIAINLISRAK
jgi:hypothetical protein